MSQATSPRRQRRHLHFDALIQRARRRFEQLPEQRRCPDFSLADALMAGLALFSLKDPSLLAFCRRCVDHNLRSVFGLRAIPSHTQMREILDGLDPDHLRPVFTDLFRQVQRGKGLEDYVFRGGCTLGALDGAEYSRSKKSHWEPGRGCHPPNAEASCSPQLPGAAIAQPDTPELSPLAPEPIQRQDGQL